MATAPTAQTLYVRIVSPKQTLFEGQALAVSSKNSQGNFDILPEHANFITIARDAPVVVLTLEKKKITFNLPLSIIVNLSNRVNVYTDILSY